MRKEVEILINNSKIDETKLPEVMEIIERAADIMEESDYDTDQEVKEELFSLQDRLRKLTKKDDFDILSVNEYWSYTSLETMAEKALMREPYEYGLSETALKELIAELFNSKALEKESTYDYWTEFLERETKIRDVMDFFYNLDDNGNVEYASVDEIMERIYNEKNL